MYIVEVLPLGRGIPQDPLSYFSHEEYVRGSIVTIPVRKSAMPAIVLSSEEAMSMKAALRAATFSLRKLPEQTDVGTVPLALMKTAERVAHFHGISTGQALAAMLPKEVREGTVPFRSSHEDDGRIPPYDAKPRIFIAAEHERYAEYARLVRESFANHRSIVFVVPTLEHIDRFDALLSQGISQYSVVLHSGRSTKTLRDAYERLATETHPLLIITTPQYGATARTDIGTIVMEHERGLGYHGKTRPYLDYRFVFSTYATEIGATAILADAIPRAEEVEALYTDRALPLKEMPRRLEFRGQLSIVSMEPDSNGTIPFTLFSKKLERAIETAMKHKKHIFLFAARRGLAPLIACVDCGHIFRDQESGSPLSLIRSIKDGVEKRTLVSSVSGFRMPAPDTCPTCGGWRLKERGIGIQHVYDDLIRKYEARFITLMDRENAASHKKAVVLRDAFYGNPGGIMLGTALSLPYLSGLVDLSAIISMDSLRALPSWRQEEETMSILCHLREKTRGSVYVQTRTTADDELFSFAEKGSIQEFYERELALREAFKYPPYTVFIHLAWRETGREDASAIRKLVSELFAPYGISIYSAPHRTPEGGTGYGLVRIERALWPHDEVVARLRRLPPSVRIMLNPDRIV